jgi:regulator of RNase E activity RraA
MKSVYTLALSFLMLAGLPGRSSAQTLSKEELTFLTAEWKGERFPDGRPRIPDSLVESAKSIGIDEAWTILENEGYHCQFEGKWKTIHPDSVMAGRAVTALFMPARPDVEKNILKRGHDKGLKGNTNSWPIQQLARGDIYVADGFGKIAEGTLIGDNLGNAIYAKSGNGVIFDAGARDLDGLKEIAGFNAFVRDWHPSFLKNVMLTGLNTPIRIGGAVVLPGDLVLAKDGGVLFIPAHLAEKVVRIATFIAMKDQFGHEVLKSGKYTPGEIDNQWTDKIREDFLQWSKEHPGPLRMDRETLNKFLQDRTW